MKTKYQRAKKKFVKKRIYRYHLDYGNWGEEGEFINGGGFTIKHWGKDEEYQILMEIAKLPFHKGFWKARKIANHSNPWKFYYDKKVKI